VSRVSESAIVYSKFHDFFADGSHLPGIMAVEIGDSRGGPVKNNRSVLLQLFATGAIAMIALVGPARAASADVTLQASNWQFSPAVIEAHVGVPVTLHVTSTEGVHGISSDELGIPNTMLTPGKTVTVTFTPKKAGTYDVHCSVPCGPGHADMKFTVKVEP
jgi:cytochrome c oxidase subunit 2